MRRRCGELDGALALALVSSFPEAVFLLDGARRILMANPRAAQLLLWYPPERPVLDNQGEIGRALGEALDASAPAPVRWLRVTVSDGVFRATAIAIGEDRLAVFARPEILREGEALAALTEGLGLGPAAARLALRVARGQSNAEIAHALRIAEGTVKSRTSAVYRKLGLGGRRDLARAVEKVLRRRRLASPRGPHMPATRGAVPSVPGAADLAAVLQMVEDLDRGLLLLDASGPGLWANAEARHILASEPDGHGQAVAAAREQVGGEAGGPGERSPPWTDILGGRARLRAWPAGGERIGAEVVRRLPRLEDLETTLVSRWGLTRRQATAAVLIGRGASNREVAQEMGLQTGTVAALSNAIYERLGGRADLVALIDSLTDRRDEG